MALNAGAVVASFKGEVSGIKSAINDVKKDTSSLGGHFRSLAGDLKNIGTTLTVAVTAPLVLFGKTAFDTAVQTEAAWKRVQKVYDGTADSITNELMPAAKQLSIEFGKQKLEVIDVMEQLAAMGEQGTGLIDKTRQAMHFAANGGLELNEGLAAVVATSAVFGVKGEELTTMLASMNTAENAGTASMGDLGVAINTVGNVAKASGVNVKELNAMMSVLRQRAVESGEAANSLKTIFTRLRRPNEAATEIMDKYGISIFETEKVTKELTRTVGGNADEVERLQKILESKTKSLKNYEAGVSGATLTDEARQKRLESLRAEIANTEAAIKSNAGTTEKYTGTVDVNTGKLKDADAILIDLAKSWGKMTDAEREEISFSVGTMFQKDKFLALMDDLNSESSEYNRILQAQADDTANLNKYNEELNIFLDQSLTKVQQAQIAWAELKETFGNILINAILPLLQKFRDLVSWIDGLDPKIQQGIVVFAALAAAIGPILVILGTLISSIMTISSAFTALSAIVAGLSVPFLPFIAIIGAVIAIFFAMRQAWENNTAGIRDAWMQLFNSFKPLWEQFIILLQMLQPVVTWLWQNILQPFFTWLWDTFVQVFANIILMLTGTIQVIVGIFQLLANMVIAAIAILVAVVTGDWERLTQLLIANAKFFKEALSNIFNGILNFFKGWGGAVYNALVKPFVDAFNKIKEIALKIKDAASEINPFKKHSPSLVELVTKGTSKIGDQYAMLADKVGNMDFTSSIANLGNVSNPSAPVPAYAGANGKQVTINNYNTLQDSADEQQLSERMAYQLRTRTDI